MNVLDEFKNYKRKFIQISHRTAILMHIFEKSNDDFEDIILSDHEEYYKQNHNINIYKEAADQFFKLIQANPEKSTKENVIITLAVCYEENLDFKGAIQVLEKYKAIHPQPDYIELRIRRLKERLKNAPGARGMRK